MVTAHLGLSHTAQAAPGRKNLESKQTGAGGSHGSQKEMSHPNSQSRAVAELGAEPGAAAHQPGHSLGRTLIFNFPVPPFHPSCLSDLPSIPIPWGKQESFLPAASLLQRNDIFYLLFHLNY